MDVVAGALCHTSVGAGCRHLHALAYAQRKTQSTYQASKVRELTKIIDLMNGVQISGGVFNMSGATVVDTSVAAIYTRRKTADCRRRPPAKILTVALDEQALNRLKRDRSIPTGPCTLPSRYVDRRTFEPRASRPEIMATGGETLTATKHRGRVDGTKYFRNAT